ncbi:hypothetical protein C7H84_09600 [Burkholderia sp. Nafp2/4-1b]|uniref:hypothetical protein n=1 Tax=Burkholderia sp. Nafp2/4-1b TaxID=2116686 RepID=UPI000EF96EF2|nr:hypothetical protein [Burkholderia sp. Nafp2/4-1b]RKU03382.1 hypothetical protein C7H84_09600 [Burkholderia sp. Nafp2/4-1b]
MITHTETNRAHALTPKQPGFVTTTLSLIGLSARSRIRKIYKALRALVTGSLVEQPAVAPIDDAPEWYFREVHPGWPEFNKANVFSDGQGGGQAPYTSTASEPAAAAAQTVVELGEHHHDAAYEYALAGWTATMAALTMRKSMERDYASQVHELIAGLWIKRAVDGRPELERRLALVREQTATILFVQPDQRKSTWPPLEPAHLESILSAYSDGYSEAYTGGSLANRFAESGSLAEAWRNGRRDGTWARERCRPLAPGEDAIPSPRAVPTAAAHDVLMERRRQIEFEGVTFERDDGYQDAELSRAAAAYALSASGLSNAVTLDFWPWITDWWKPTTPRRDLVKAGALILAAIERIDRDAARTQAHARRNEPICR